MYQTHNSRQGKCWSLDISQEAAEKLLCYFSWYLVWWTFPAAEDPGGFGRWPAVTQGCHSSSSLHVSRHRVSKAQVRGDIWDIRPWLHGAICRASPGVRTWQIPWAQTSHTGSNQVQKGFAPGICPGWACTWAHGSEKAQTLISHPQTDYSTVFSQKRSTKLGAFWGGSACKALKTIKVHFISLWAGPAGQISLSVLPLKPTISILTTF